MVWKVQSQLVPRAVPHKLEDSLCYGKGSSEHGMGEFCILHVPPLPPFLRKV